MMVGVETVRVWNSCHAWRSGIGRSRSDMHLPPGIWSGKKSYDESIYLPRVWQHYNSIQKKRGILP